LGFQGLLAFFCSSMVRVGWLKVGIFSQLTQLS